MSIGATFTVTILLVIMAEVSGYFLLKEIVKSSRTAGQLQVKNYIVHEPAYSSREPVIDTSNMSWENFNKWNLYTKICIAATERTANKTYDGNEIVEKITQNPLLVSDHVAPLEREDKFIPEGYGWFEFLHSDVDHLNDIKTWMNKVVNKNGYLKKFGKDFPGNFAEVALHRLKYLKSICENQVEASQEERLMDFKILEMPSENNQPVHIHVYKMKVWVDCESFTNMGGLVYEYTKYTFKTRVPLVDRLSGTAKDKAVEALKCFLKKVAGPEPGSGTTTATTQKPTITTTIKPTTTATTTTAKTAKSTVHIHLVGDCEAED